MTQRWSRVRLGEVLSRSSESVRLCADTDYREVTVKLWGKGAILRRIAKGRDIATATRHVARRGDLILSRIDARHGAIAIVPAELDGAIVSNDFPLYGIDKSRIQPEYLGWMCVAPAFREQCEVASEGTTNRIRLREDRFLECEIPVPPLEAQRDVAGRIDALACKVRRAAQLREQSIEVAYGLFASHLANTFTQLANESPLAPLGAALSRRRHIAPLEAGVTYKGLGTRMWGLGVYVHEERPGSDFRAERYVVRPTQLIYNEVWAHQGALGIVPEVGANPVVSRHFHVFDVDWSKLCVDFVQRMFQSPWFWEQCRDGSVSTTGRGHLRREHFMAIQIPVPTASRQQEIVSALAAVESRVKQLLTIQHIGAEELDAVLPSFLDRAFQGEP